MFVVFGITGESADADILIEELNPIQAVIE